MHAFAGRMRKGADMLSSFCSALFSRFRVAVAALFIALLVFLFMLLAPSSAYATTYDSDVQANSPPVDVAEIATEETNAVTSDDDSTEVTVVSGDENTEIVNSASDLQELENDESQEEIAEDDSTQANGTDTDEGEALDSNTTESDEDRASDDVNDDVDDNNTNESADDGQVTDSDSAVDTTTNDSNESADQPAETTEEDVVAITTPDQERDYQDNATAEAGANTETEQVTGESSSPTVIAERYSFDNVIVDGSSIPVLKVERTVCVNGVVSNVVLTLASNSVASASSVFGDISTDSAGTYMYLGASPDCTYYESELHFGSDARVFFNNFDPDTGEYLIPSIARKYIYLGMGDMLIGINIPEDQSDSPVFELLPALSSPGFNHVNWFIEDTELDINAGQPFSEVYDEDYYWTIRAKWEPVPFQVVFLYDYSNEISLVGNVTAYGAEDENGDPVSNYISDDTVTGVESKLDGYDFLGWAYKPYAEDRNEVFTREKTRTVAGTTKQYMLRSDMRPDAYFLAAGESIPFEDIYYFLSSSGAIDYEALPDNFDPAYIMLSMYPVWGKEETESWTVEFTTYDDQQGTLGGTTEVSVAKGGKISASDIPSKNRKVGYDFDYWMLDGDTTHYSDSTLANMTINADRTVTAYWKAREGYTVTYSMGSAASETGTSLNKTQDTGLAWTGSFTTATASWDGHTFLGWYYGDTKVANGGSSVNFNTLATAANPTAAYPDELTNSTLALVAKWGEKTYTVHYNTNGGSPSSIPDATNVTYNQFIPLPNYTVTQTGYENQGWYTAQTGGDLIQGTTVSTNKKYSDIAGSDSVTEITIYLHWAEKIVKVEYQVINTGATISAGSTANETTITEYVGASSGDLYTGDGTGATKITSGKTSVGNVTWSLGKNAGGQTVYDYVGWYTDAAHNTAATNAVAGNPPAAFTPAKSSGEYKAATYYLYVTPKEFQYVIEYYVQNLAGTGYDRLNTGGVTVTGDGLSGNNKASYNTTVGVTGMTPAGDTTVTPATAATSANLTGFTFDSDATSANGINFITIDYAASAGTTPNILRLYYSRDSYAYSYAFNAVGTNAGINLPALTADHKNASDTTIKYGDTIQIAAPESKTGYTFNGWTGTYGSGTAMTTITNNADGSASIVMPAGAITLTGNWTAIPYYVKYINDTASGHGNWGTIVLNGDNVDATSGKVVTFNYGDNLTQPTVTAANGYYFLGFEYAYTDGTSTTRRASNLSGLALTNENFQLSGPGSATSPALTLIARWDVVMSFVYTDGDGGHGNFDTVSKSNMKVDDTDFYIPSYVDLGGKTDSDSTNKRNSGHPKADEGYTFVGWNTASDGTGEWLFAASTGTEYADSTESGASNRGTLFVGMTPTQSRTFYAIFKATTQTLKFNDTSSNGVTGSFTDSAHACGMADTNSTFTLPTDLTKAGYTLTGWTYNDGTTTRTISVTTGNPATVTVGAGVENGADTGVYGYTFTPVFSETTVKYEYKFADGSAGMGTLTKTLEELGASTGTIVGSTASANSGYEFKGWFTNASHTSPVTGIVSGTNKETITPQKNADGVYEGGVFYAYFVPVKYQVTIKIDTDNNGTLSYGTTTGATEYPNADYDYGTKIQDILTDAGITVVPNTGYNHTGWKINGTTYSTSSIGTLTVNGITTIFPVFAEKEYTVNYVVNGGSPSPSARTDVKWSASAAPNVTVTRTGYDFGGWYADAGLTKLVGSGNYDETFEAAATAYAGSAASFSGTTLTLYAKWNAKSGYTVIYDAFRNGSGAPGSAYDASTGQGDYPTSITNPANLPVTWDQTGLIPSLTAPDGWTLDGWYLSTTDPADITRSYITGSTAYSDLASGVDATGTSVTLYAHWTHLPYTINYKDGAATVHTETKYWEDIVPAFSPTPSAAKQFNGWLYNTNAAGTSQAKVDSSTKISDVARNNAATRTLEVKADWKNNQFYTVTYYRLNRNADGSYTAETTQAVQYTGYVLPGSAVDVTSVADTDGTTYNYWTDKYAELGYAPDTDGLRAASAGKSNVTRFSEAKNSGSGTLEFVLYFYEKAYTIVYDAGVPGVSVDSRTVGWNDSPITPTTNPSRDGYDAPVWKYGTSTVSSSTSVYSLLNPNLTDKAGDDDATITLVADWSVASVTISYEAKAQDGGTNAGGNVTSLSETVNAVGQAPASVTANVTDPGYKLLGWYYNDGTNNIQVVANSSDADSLVLTLDAGTDENPLTTRTYFALFAPRSSLNYTVEHYYMKTDGTYDTVASRTDTDAGLEGATISASSKARTSETGLTYDPSATGSIGSITLQTTDTANRTLKLYYVRDAYTVTVNPYATGADHPTTMPSIDSSALSGTVYYDATAPLPTVTTDDGWTLQWQVDNNAPLSAGATTFSVPVEAGGVVTLTGVWTRANHTVTFGKLTADTPEPKASFDLTGTTTTTVAHDKTLAESGFDYTTAVAVVNPDKYVLTGWKVLGADGETVLSAQIDDPSTWTITQDTYFIAQWKQVYTVTYYRGDHAVSGTAAHYEYGPYAESNNDTMPVWDDTNANPTAAAGYEFIGWTWSLTDDSGTTKYAWYADGKTPADTTGVTIVSAMPTEIRNNYSFTAAYAALARTLSFSNVDGTWNDPSASHTVSTATGETVTTGIPVESDIEYAGHKLLGWKLASDDSATPQVYTNVTGFTVPETDDATIELVPVWETTSVTITYEVIGEGSRSVASVSVLSDAAAAGSSVAKANPGYVFDGWYTDSAATTKVPDEWVTGNATDGYTITPQKSGDWAAATYYAKFVAGTDTAYTVWYYMQNVGLDGYTHDTSLDKNATGTTGAKATVAGNYLNATDSAGFTPTTDNGGVDTEVVILGTGQTVLKVYYDRLKYNVTYVYENAPASDAITWSPAVPVNGEVVYGAEVSLPGASAVGYSFAWSAKDGDSATVAISNGKFTMPASAVTVTGTWTANNYGITYDKNATGQYTDVTVPANDSNVAWGQASLLPSTNPTRTGYDFAGWTVSDGTDGTKSGTLDTSDHSGMTYGDLAKKAYEAAGYTSEAALSNLIATNGLKVAPIWTPQNNNVNYAIDGTDSGTGKWKDGFAPTTSVATDDTSFTAPAKGDIHKDGKTLDKWILTYTDTYTDPDNPMNVRVELNPGQAWNTPMPAAEITLTPVWGDITYTVSYDTDGGSAVASRSTTWDATDLDEDGSGTKLAPTKAGYTFNGWIYVKDGKDYNYSATPYSDIAKNDEDTEVSLKATWTANTYDIVFNGNGATSGSMSNQTVTFDDASATLTANDYKLSGKRFLGWATSQARADAGEVDRADGAAAMKDSSNLVVDAATDGSTITTLFAVWGDVSYTVKYDTNGGSSLADRGNVAWDATDLDTDGAGNAQAPTKTGYKLVGWTYGGDDDAQYQYVNGTTAYSTIAGADDVYDVTLKAQWEAITYTVEFDGNGGTGTMGNQTLTYDKSETISPNGFTYNGRTFLGWSEDPDATNPSIAPDATRAFNLKSAEGEAAKLYAIWAETTYTVVYDMDGGNAIADRTDVKWDTANLDTDGTSGYSPTKTGYDFNGWVYGTSRTPYNTATPYSTLAGSDTVTSVTLIATWKNKVYHIVFDDGFDASGADKWSNEPNATTTDNFGRYQSDTSSTTNNIGWNDANWLPMVKGDNTKELIPTRAGYVFAGWAYGAEGKPLTLANNEQITFAMLTDNDDTKSIVTITATWKPYVYRVVYQDVNNGSVIDGTSTSTLWTGGWYDNVSASDPAAKSGYTFIGYTTDLAGNNAFVAGAYNGLSTTPAPNTSVNTTSGAADTDFPTLYAQWKKNVDFGLKVYKEDANGNLVLVDVPTEASNTTWTSYEGQVITANADGTITITSGNPADGATFATPAVPVLAGYTYDSAQSTLTLSALNAAEAMRYLILAYKPKTQSDGGESYKVEYYDESGNKIGAKTVNNWAAKGLAPDETPTKLGYTLDGYGWNTAQDGSGKDVTDATTYGDLAVDSQGNPDDSITTVKVFVQWLARQYHINYVDSTDGNGTDLTADNYKYIASSNGAKNPAASTDKMKWADTVTLYDVTDERLANTLHQTGWKFMGWALSAAAAKAGTVDVADGSAFNALFQAQNSSIDADTLATYDVDSNVNSDGLFLYAVWAKYVPYVVKYWTTDGTYTTLVEDVTHNASEKGAYLGGTTTVGTDDVAKHRPAGYLLPTGTPQNGTPFASENAEGNVIDVIYTLYTEYKLNFDKNVPGATASDIVQTLTGLNWASKPYSDSEGITPTLQGYTLKDMPKRWTTNRDGSGLIFERGTTYADIAKAIAGSAVVDDVAIRETGLTLFAQWDENAIYKVVYDLNNDKSVNTNVLTDVPSTLTPINPDVLKKDPVKWTASGFNDASELNAAPYGYEFAGWNTARDGSGLTVLDATKYSELSNAVNPNEEQASVTLFAQWKEIEITITYTTDGNGTVDRTVDKVSAVTGKPVGTGSSSGAVLTSTATAKPGYHFVKWVLVTDDSSTGGLSTAAVTNMVGGENGTVVDITKLTVSNGEDGLLHTAAYKALFEANDNATLVYDANGGTGSVVSDTEPFGSLLTLSSGSTLKRSYYTLKGWNTKADGTGTTYALNQTNYELPEGTTTLYAMWDANEYTVTIGGDTEGGTVTGTTSTVKYGEKASSGTVTSASATPATGKRLAYWTYTMIDDETGETITGKVSDPSELEIKGAVTFTPVFEDDPDYVDPSKQASSKGAPATGAGTGELLPQTGDANGMSLLLVVALVAALVVVFAARRRHDNSSNDPPSPGSPRRGGRNGSIALGIAVAVLITTGTALAPDEAFALGDDEQATAVTEDQNEAENAEAESNDSASGLYDQAADDSAESPVADDAAVLDEPAGDELSDASEDAAGNVDDQETLQTAPADQGDRPKAGSDESDEPDGEDAIADETASQDEDASQDEQPEAAGTLVPVTEVSSAPEAVEPQDEVLEDTKTAQEDNGRQTAAEEARVQLKVPEVVKVATLGISIASISVEPVESDFQEGQYYLKEGVNEQAALAVANGRVVAAAKEATGVSNHWDIYRVAGSTDKTLFTIKCGELYLAYADGQLFLTNTPGETAHWHIASYMLAGNSVIAIYSASKAAVLGISGDVSHVPFCSTGHSDEYPELPGSKELQWIPESVMALPWTITFNANGGTGTMGDANVIQVPGGESSPALVNEFKRAGYSFAGWLDSDGESYADGAVIDRELYVSNYNLTLTAQWKEDSVQVVYAAGTGGAVQLGTGGASASRVVETVGAATGIVRGTASQTFSGSRAVANRGYHFNGWAVSGVPSSASKTDLDSIEKTSATLDGSTVSELSVAPDTEANGTVYHALSFTSSFTANTYTVSYDINGGVGQVASTSATYGGDGAVASAASVASREGYLFSGWNTRADGSGVSVADGATLTVATLDKLISSGAVSASGNDSTTLFAQWTAIPVADTPAADEDNMASAITDFLTPNEVQDSGSDGAFYAPMSSGSLLREVAAVAEQATASPVAETVKEAAGALQVTPVSSSPIVTAAASGSWADGAASTDAVDAVEAFANMSSTEKVQVAGNVVTTLAAVSAVAGLLGVGVPVVAAFVAGIMGVAGTAGATGAADLAAELAAASTAGGLWSRIRRKFNGGAAEGDDEEDDEL